MKVCLPGQVTDDKDKDDQHKDDAEVFVSPPPSSSLSPSKPLYELYNLKCLDDIAQSVTLFLLSVMFLSISFSFSLFLYFSVSLFLCFSVSLFLCFSVSLIR